MNTTELKAEIVRKGYKSLEAFAKDAQLDRGSFFRKLRGSTDFKLGEVQKIVDALGLSDQEIRIIFFNP